MLLVRNGQFIMSLNVPDVNACRVLAVALESVQERFGKSVCLHSLYHWSHCQAVCHDPITLSACTWTQTSDATPFLYSTVCISLWSYSKCKNYWWCKPFFQRTGYCLVPSGRMIGTELFLRKPVMVKSSQPSPLTSKSSQRNWRTTERIWVRTWNHF